MKRKLTSTVAAVLLCAVVLAGCDEPKTLRGKIVHNTDRLANSLTLVGGTVRDLHAAGKLSDAQAKAWGEALLKANGFAETGTNKLKEYVAANPDATELPAQLKFDLDSILTNIERALTSVESAADSNLLKAVREVIGTVNTIRRLTK